MKWRGLLKEKIFCRHFEKKDNKENNRDKAEWEMEKKVFLGTVKT